MRPQFGQRCVGLLGYEIFQTLFAARAQQRLAATQVSLRFQGATLLELLAHAPYGSHAVAQAGGDFTGALALIIKVNDPFTYRNRNGFHTHTLPDQPQPRKLHNLWKCSRDGR